MLKLLITLFLIPFGLFAQQSDLFLFDIHKFSDRLDVSNPRLLSGFNPGGYTNQPHFLDLFTMVISAGRVPSPIETDIYQLNIRNDQLIRVTKTPDREYSPMSGPDRDHLSCVLVDGDDQEKQILWSYPLDRSHGGKAILKDITKVGYYCWIDRRQVAVFEVGDPSQLFICNIADGTKKFISSKVGRCLKKLPDGSLAFVHKISEEYWFIKKVHPETHSIDVVKKTLPGSEDFEVMRDGTILMAKESKIYALGPSEGSQWVEVADLEPAGLKAISRLAYNGVNLLAVVNDRQ